MTAPEIPDRCEAVIVGAGLAGLACARTLRAAGRDVIVIEASDAVGGRVRTDVVDGFLLDRGFQVVLTAYPELERQLDVSALRLQHFEPGALVWRGGRGAVVADPFRSPRHALSTALAPIGSPWDKIRIARLRRRVQRTPVPALLRGDDVPTLDGLRAEGFSAKAIDRFFRPLFGGIQLDPDLKTSSRMFTTIFRMLADGSAAVPALGMGAIPSQLAACLEPWRIVTGTRVEHVAPGRVTLAGGRTIGARAVVVATEGPTASNLVGIAPVGSKSVTGLWFAAPRPPVPHRLVVLDGDGTGPAMNVAVLSNVAPTYAPEGQALVVAAVPGVASTDLEGPVRRQLRAWWGREIDDWRLLRTYPIDHGQPDQQPPLHPRQRVVLGEGLFVCGDHRDTASIQGALHSGRRCGEAAARSLAMAE